MWSLHRDGPCNSLHEEPAHRWLLEARLLKYEHPQSLSEKMGKLKGFQQENSIWTSEENLRKTWQMQQIWQISASFESFGFRAAKRRLHFSEIMAARVAWKKHRNLGRSHWMSHYNRWITIISSPLAGNDVFKKGGDHVVQKNMRNAWKSALEKKWKTSRFFLQISVQVRLESAAIWVDRLINIIEPSHDYIIDLQFIHYIAGIFPSSSIIKCRLVQHSHKKSVLTFHDTSTYIIEVHNTKIVFEEWSIYK